MARPFRFTLFGLWALAAGCSVDWSVRRAQDGGVDAEPAGKDDAEAAAQEPDEDGGPAELDADCPEALETEQTCAPGQAVSCTTSCGSNGSGICSEACRPPDAEACSVPVESCNLVDDDCDGFTDEGDFWTQQQPAFAAWTQGGFTADARYNGFAMLELAPRAGGGAWLFHSAKYGSIQVAQLDAAGELVARESSLAAITSETNEYRVDSHAGVLALVTTEGDDKAATSLRVRLLNTADLSVLAEFEPLSVSMRTFRLFATSLLTDRQGTQRVLVAYGERAAADEPGAHAVKMRVFSRTLQGERALSVPVDLAAPTTLAFVDAVRMPCRDEWLLSAWANRPGGQIEQVLRRVSPEPAFVGPARIEALPGLVELAGAAYQPDCDVAGASELLLAYGHSVGQGVKTPVRLRRWRVHHETGAIDVLNAGSEPDLGQVINVRAQYWGGSWFVAAFRDGIGELGFFGLPVLLAIPDRQGEAVQLPLFAAGGPDPGQALSIEVVNRVRSGVALLHAGERLVMALSNGVLDRGMGSEPALSASGSDPITNPVIAATYSFGCPD
jgi:hypothetical protein